MAQPVINKVRVGVLSAVVQFLFGLLAGLCLWHECPITAHLTPNCSSNTIIKYCSVLASSQFAAEVNALHAEFKVLSSAPAVYTHDDRMGLIAFSRLLHGLRAIGLNCFEPLLPKVQS